MALYGSMPMLNRKWTPGVAIGDTQTVPEEFIVDPSLVPLGSDPRYPNSDQIVIPRGRFLAVRRDIASYEGRAVLTIADGVDPANKPATTYSGGSHPAGFTESNIFRKWAEHDQWTPTLWRNKYIELPYVPGINNAYGALASGDRLTAYFGSVASVTPAQTNKGKMVKWVERKLYNQHQGAAGTASLAAAIYPAFPPQIVLAMSTGTVSTASITLAFNGTNWVATLASGTVTDILYTMGQSPDQIAGELIHIEPLSATKQYDGWLKWVTDDFRLWDYPPALMRVPTTVYTAEALTYISPNVFRTANKPIAPHISITVTLAPTGADTFVITTTDGTSTTISSGATYDLPLSDIPYQDYTLGVYHNINPVTGEVFLSGNVAFTGSLPSAGSTLYALKISYSAETGYRDGRLFQNGQIGLTDGSGGTGYPGTPANLDVVGGAGSLRAIIY